MEEKKILFVSSEVFGGENNRGLTELVESLREKKEGSYDLRIVTPQYSQITQDKLEGLDQVAEFKTQISWRKDLVSVNKVEKDGLTHYLVDNKDYFDRATLDFEDDSHLQFSYFCYAVLDMLPKIDFKPDIIQCQGWKTGPLTLLLKEVYGGNDFYKDIKTIFTIDDISSQGAFGRDIIDDALDIDWKYFNDGRIEHDGLVNYLKMGVEFADALIVFGKDFAQTIKTPEGGGGLDYLIRMNEKKLHIIDLDDIVKEYQSLYSKLSNQGVKEEKKAKVIKLDVKDKKEEIFNKININTAAMSDLTKINGVGPALAERIVAYREKAGSFKEIKDITKVSGIGKKLFKKIKDNIIN